MHVQAIRQPCIHVSDFHIVHKHNFSDIKETWDRCLFEYFLSVVLICLFNKLLSSVVSYYVPVVFIDFCF